MTIEAAAGVWERGLVAVRGVDARSFLQGLVSNDALRVDPERAIYAALLTPQGKYLFDFVIVDDGRGIVLDTESWRRDDLVRRLTMYRLRAAVEIEPLEDHAVALVVGPDAAARTGLPALAGAARMEGALVLVVDPRATALGVRVLGPAHAVAEYLAAVALPALDRLAYDRLRIGLAVPDGSRDLIVQGSTLAEGNFEQLHGIAFDKGCFIGQELTARMKHRGLLKKRLVPVRIDGTAPPPGTPVTAGAHDAGEVRSTAGDLGLVLLRLEHVHPGAELTAAGVRLVPVPPEWMSASTPRSKD